MLVTRFGVIVILGLELCFGSRACAVTQPQLGMRSGTASSCLFSIEFVMRSIGVLVRSWYEALRSFGTPPSAKFARLSSAI